MSATERVTPTGGEPVDGGAADDTVAPPPGAAAASVVILFYTYRDIEVQAEAELQRAECEGLGLLGRVLVAGEGLNGTLAGPPDAVSAYVDGMVRRLVGLSHSDFKTSTHDGPPTQLFPDLQVNPIRQAATTARLPPGWAAFRGGHGALRPRSLERRPSPRCALIHHVAALHQVQVSNC